MSVSIQTKEWLRKVSLLGYYVAAFFASLMVVHLTGVFEASGSSQLGVIVEIAVITLVAQILIITVYRIKFHPLAQYPGPTWAKVTDWYSVYHCFIGDRHIDFYRLHCKYGDVVRFGPNRIAVNSNTALRDIHAVRANTQKSQYYSVFSHFFKVPMSMTTIDKKKHAFKRRVDSEALSANTIKSMESLVLDNARTFCRYMVDEKPAGEWSDARDMTNWFGYLMFDIMGDIVFNRNWDMMAVEDNRPIIDTLTQGVSGLNLSGHMPQILSLKLDKLLFRKLTAGTYQYQALSKAQSGWRIANAATLKTRDIFSALLSARDPETGLGFTHEELVSEAALLIIAGSSTSASALTATVFYILHYPRTLALVQKEIRSTFIDVEEIHGGPKLASCRYLRACIDEAMRLSPGVGGILPREVLPGGLTIDANYFPPSTDIGVATYAIHHNPIYFPDPFLFKPERWLSDPPEALTGTENAVPYVSKEEVALAQSAYTPFGVGRASCVGKTLAYQEKGYILSRLIWPYDMSLQDGVADQKGDPLLEVDRGGNVDFEFYDRFVSVHEGPLVKFRPRHSD
ncbi:hypothetical protein MMC30_001445 [Trapelia coarctata]|nr:hypothetical protein [Trapelia coarctata]